MIANIDSNRDYEFNHFVSVISDLYTRKTVIEQTMKLRVPVIWRNERLLVSGSFILDLLNNRISL